MSKIIKHRRKFSIFLVFLLVIQLFGGNTIVFAANQSSLVKNSSFEEVEEDTSGNWENGIAATNWNEVWKPIGEPLVSVTDEESYSGEHSIEIYAEETSRASLTQEVDIQDNNTYILSGWIKTDQVTSQQGARLRIVSFKGDEQLRGIFYSARVDGTSDWTYIEEIFVPEAGVDNVRVQFFLEEGTGTAWFDDVNLEKVEEDTILQNGSFESFEESTAPAWENNQAFNWNVWKPTGNPLVDVANDEAYEGNHSLKISAESQGRAAVSQDVPITGGQTYKVSSWIKTEDVSNTARMRVVYYEGDTQIELVHFGNVSNTKDWTKVEKVMTPPENIDSLRIQNFLEAGTGTAWFDNLVVEEWVPVESLTLAEEEITLIQQDSVEIGWEVLPETATDQHVDWVSSNESVAMVEDGVVTAITEGTANINAITRDGSITESLVVHVQASGEEIPVESIDITTTVGEINEGYYTLLSVGLTPISASKNSLNWVSTNENVATVEDGLVKGVSPGVTEISAETADGSVKSEPVTIEVKAYQQDEYDELRFRWREDLLGEEAFDPTNEKMIKVVEDQTESSQELWMTLVKNNNRSFLWNNLNSTTDSTVITTNYRNLYALTKSFVTKESTLYHDTELLEDITAAMEWMYENQYNENISQYSNWWHWEIGAPRALNDIVVLLYEYLDPETIEKYMNVVDHFQPDPTMSGATTPDRHREALGANRIDVSKVVSVRGIIVKDSEKIAATRDAISQVLEYVDEGNGFYRDGSFVQHEDIAYTGSYGTVLLGGATEILELLSNSSWEVVDSNIDNIYQWVYDSYMPIMYKGSLMDMIRGRAISRENAQTTRTGRAVIRPLIRLAQFAPEPHSQRFKEMAKYWIQENHYFSYIDNSSNFRDIQLANEILEDQSIESRIDNNYHKNFAAMDRVVHKRLDYTFGISMYSNRIQNYEDMNNENRKGWYTGEGMTYLYNNDLSQFDNGFWPTVDPYRLPGTTVDTRPRYDGDGMHRSVEAWVGGSVLQDKYGTTGMSYNSDNSSLTAKKSWFMFDDEIVALGAGITNQDDYNVETIVENRKISDDGSNKFVINDETLSEGLGEERTIEDANWAFLEGNIAESDIGYYFPEPTTIQVKKEQREGAWSDVNYTESNELIQRSYATMWIDHGERPTDDNYSYVLLPNKTEQEVKSYAQEPEIEILENNAALQAVQHISKNIMGVNFWEDETQTVGTLTSHQKSSVTLENTEAGLEIAISDPTMENDEFIEIEIKEEGLQVLENDERIEVLQLSPTIKLQLDTKDAKGQSFSATIQTDIMPVDPILDVTGLTDGLTVSSPALAFTVYGEDYRGQQLAPLVTLNENEVTENADGEYTVELIEGENLITISVTDEGGREVSESYSIIYELEETGTDEPEETEDPTETEDPSTNDPDIDEDDESIVVDEEDKNNENAGDSELPKTASTIYNFMLLGGLLLASGLLMVSVRKRKLKVTE